MVARPVVAQPMVAQPMVAQPMVALFPRLIIQPPPSPHGANRSATPGITPKSALISPPPPDYQTTPFFISVPTINPVDQPRNYTK
jgi:hypothetical protein